MFKSNPRLLIPPLLAKLANFDVLPLDEGLLEIDEKYRLDLIEVFGTDNVVEIEDYLWSELSKYCLLRESTYKYNDSADEFEVRIYDCLGFYVVMAWMIVPPVSASWYALAWDKEELREKLDKILGIIIECLNVALDHVKHNLQYMEEPSTQDELRSHVEDLHKLINETKAYKNNIQQIIEKLGEGEQHE